MTDQRYTPDDLDRRLLAELSGDARLPVATLAHRLGIARSTAQARLERLERTGVIAGYTLRLGAAAAAGTIRATVLLQVEPRANATVLQRLKALPQVRRAHSTSGRFDLALVVAAGSTEELDRALDAIGAVPGVTDSESLIHLSTKIDRGS
ncbi:Lrp/AsnC family transcriptional regulator [Palleronia sp. KMU-117]|uniref:Lrp/AsnC family transcriptional regulator n=1 Tax=Palleronia sp. KMU-117 TaxID=3434108 RepID=UPI003D708485